jgi:hypothetical protein
MTQEQLNTEYTRLMQEAELVTGRKEAVSFLELLCRKNLRLLTTLQDVLLSQTFKQNYHR